MTRLPTAAVSAVSLLAGFGVAQATGVRALGGVVLVAGAAWCAREWLQHGGVPVAVGLTGAYVGAFVGSHLLAREVGAWPAVLTVSAVTAGAAWAFSDRHARALTA